MFNINYLFIIFFIETINLFPQEEFRNYFGGSFGGSE